jgi:hypothetical protein
MILSRHLVRRLTGVESELARPKRTTPMQRLQPACSLGVEEAETGRNRKGSVITVARLLEGGGKAGQGPRGRSQTKKNENAATATENAAWMARELDNGGDDNDDPFEGLPDDDDMPPLQDVSDSKSNSDDDDDDMPPLQAGYDSDDESESDGEVLELYEDDEDEPSAMLANNKKNTGMNMDLYDSGATSHMSPDRNRFTTYTRIPSKPIASTGGSTFCAVGRGNRWIEVPIGNDKAGHVLLTNVLHTPGLGSTLISIS